MIIQIIKNNININNHNRIISTAGKKQQQIQQQVQDKQQDYSHKGENRHSKNNGRRRIR